MKATRLTLEGETGPIYDPQASLFGDRVVIGWRRGPLEIEEIPSRLANQIIRENHYSQKVSRVSYIHLGVYYFGELVGAAQYGYAMNPRSQEKIVPGTGTREYVELSRLWIDDRMPGNTESAAVSLTLKYLRATTPVRWVQSFADERCRLFGGLYQACSFLYCGEHVATFWELDGEFFHNSMATRDPEQATAARYLQDNIERAVPRRIRQFRYIKFIRPKYRRDLALPVYPYPKPHAEGVRETTPAVQPGSAGAVPALRSITDPAL